MTLCNLVVPKPNKVAISSGTNGIVEGHQPADKYMNLNGTTDKNQPKTNRNEKPGFDETLRKKMNSETSHEPHNSTPKKDKIISKKEECLDSQPISNQACENYAAPEKETMTLDNADFKIDSVFKHNNEVNTETQPPVDIETSSDSDIHKIPVPIEKEDTTVTIDVPTETPLLKLVKTANKQTATSEKLISTGEIDNSSPDLSQKNQNPLKSGQIPANNGDTKPQKSKPENPVFGQKSSFETEKLNLSEKSDDGETFVTPIQEKTIKNVFIESENKEKTLLNKISENSPVKPALSIKPILSVIDEKGFTSVQYNTPPQDNKLVEGNTEIPARSQVPNEIPLSQTSAYRVNVPTEQINTKSVEKPKNSIENGFTEVKLDIHEPSSMGMLNPPADKQSVSNEPVKSMGNTISGFSVARQIQESVHSHYRPGAQQIVIRLDPPDLGRVIIRFIEQNNSITGILHVDKAATKHEIQQVLPGIIQNLENSNVPIKRLEVVLNNQPQYNTPDENSTGYNGNYEHQNTPNQNPFSNTASYDEWMENSNYIQNSTDPQIELTDKSINMLI